ncbi:unnamed protein product [Arctogadus glacialis]
MSPEVRGQDPSESWDWRLGPGQDPLESWDWRLGPGQGAGPLRDLGLKTGSRSGVRTPQRAAGTQGLEGHSSPAGRPSA